MKFEKFQRFSDVKLNKTLGLTDTDKDGVADIFDCEPNNPKKQGIWHKTKAGIARKLGNEEKAQQYEEEGKQIDEAKSEARELKREMALEKQRIKQEQKLQAIRDKPKRDAERRKEMNAIRAERRAKLKAKVQSTIQDISAKAKNYKPKSSGMSFGGGMNNNMGLGSGFNPGNPLKEFDNQSSGMRFGGDIMNPMGKPKRKRKSVKRRKKPKTMRKSAPKRQGKKVKYIVINGKKYKQV